MNNLRCRPGDLAVVLRGSGIGAIVDVLRRSVNHPLTDLPAWECTVKAPMLVDCYDMRRLVHVGKIGVGAGSHVVFMDCILQPIRPPAPPVDTDTRTPVELECT